MSWIQDLLSELSINSSSNFWTLFILLGGVAYAGKFFFKNHSPKFSDDQAKIVLGAILSLLGLLIGFVLSISINGYNDRQKTEENEMLVISSAFQRTQLLDSPQKEKAEKLLHEYLDARIEFFNADSLLENKEWRITSTEKQKQLWDIAVNEARETPNPVISSVLASYSDLYLSQEKTTVSWRDQIPKIVWALLIFFAVVSNILIGYNARQEQKMNLMILVLPFLMALSLFIISEIDVPGKGVIHVTPDDLLSLKDTLAHIAKNKN
ncbi:MULTISPECIES: hypothetical protein [Acinetobacter]|jgi:hypothetical protein|uniref:DUF4239 domain-containing protein n=1 Tax=Acinetobacter chengduensis TaxID=2420890 RepID=A0ABX9U0T0_9GAMM|nr:MULTISPECIES: hypothetical protein [Acinetobacter]MBI1451212.1 hypothetical protein [Acinetobacter sp. FL51]RKG43674.1 hypothetical protein D7V31_04140 [Acinetobacter sp. WCHAc060007]RLL23924.1 hypothetical protein D9K81_01980 [Acinetobacter chengduensis]